MAKPQLQLPVQTEPINRFKILPVFVITVPNVVSFIPDVSPIRHTYSPFSGEVDQRLGICPVLSAYAVARCFQTGGLFGP
jgi:hypothetical protein